MQQTGKSLFALRYVSFLDRENLLFWSFEITVYRSANLADLDIQNSLTFHGIGLSRFGLPRVVHMASK